MSDITIDTATTQCMKEQIQNLIKTDGEILTNPALERCVKDFKSSEESARQAYDRMYHTHNRS